MNENWPRVALRELATDIKDGTHGTHPRVGEGIPLLSAKNVSGRGKVIVSDDEELISEYEYRLITSSFAPQSGDLLITTVGTVGRRAIYDGSKVAFQRSVAFIRSRKEILADYLFHAVGSDDFARQLAQRSNATAQIGLYLGELAKVSVPLPPRPIQRRIAEILSTVDEAIEQTEVLIAKYQQIKAGLMHDLFTRGLSPAASAKGDVTWTLRPTRAQAPRLYKESPLGWIPKEWEVVPLSSVTQFITSGSRGWAEYYSEIGPLFIRIGNLTREHINFRWDSVTRVSLPKLPEGQRTAVLPNDILISITADLGIVAVADDGLGEAYVNQHIALVRPRVAPGISRFLGYFLSTVSVQNQFLRLNDSGAKAGLNLPAIGKMLVVKPVDDFEAKRIAAMLDEADLSIECHKQEAAKLRQQKHGLMHDLLTGHVRVKVGESQELSA